MRPVGPGEGPWPCWAARASGRSPAAAEPGAGILYRPGGAGTGEWRRLLADLRAAPRALSLLAVAAPARRGGAATAVAHLVVVPEAEPAAAHVARLGLLVAAGWRRRGLGGRLLEWGLSWAAANGFTRATLGVLGGNEAARRFYLAHGFVEEGRRRRQYLTDRGYDDEVLMARTLEPETTSPPA